jgi:cation diffusion facilitator family transporter
MTSLPDGQAKRNLNHGQRDTRAIFRVMLVTMLLNFLATFVKLVPGFLTGSLSVVADGLDSLFDGLSHISGFAGLYVSSKPPDEEHPYGHRKFETVAALSISFLLFLTTWQLLQTAWDRLKSPVTPDVTLWLILAMLTSMLIQGFTAWYEYRQGRRLNSEWLVVDSYHTRASILVSASVLVGLGVVRLGYPMADPILAIIVAMMIAKIGVDILRETLPVLVDRAVIDSRTIEEITSSVAGVESYHRVRSRGTPDSAAVDLHVRVSPQLTVQQANAIGDEVRRRLLALNGVSDVTVHVEAERSQQNNAAEIYATLQHTAAGMGLRVHESWVQRRDGQLVLEAHLGVDPCLTLSEAHEQVDQLEHELRHRLPEVAEFHSHIEMASDQVQESETVPPDADQAIRKIIMEVVQGFPELKSAREITMNYQHGLQAGYYIAMTCDIDPATPMTYAHQLSTMVEHELTRRLPGLAQIVIHLEPGEV